MNISKNIKQEFISFLVEKYNHKEIQNSSLVPVDDPSVLFTTAGMHPISKNLLGLPHPSGKRLTNVQRCFRTVDIEEVGDTIHHTFFEMLGNWSLGDYFSEEAIEITFSFVTQVLKFDPRRLYVSVFEGDNTCEKDENSIETWKRLFSTVGIEAEVWDGKTFTENTRIFPLNKKENWWIASSEIGPCGPDSEMFYWRGKDKPDFATFVPWDNSNMFIEICNNVFMRFSQDTRRVLTPLQQRNVDFGAGLERMTFISELMNDDGSVNLNYSVYDSELFREPRKLLEDISGKSFQESEKDEIKNLRIILDHVRATTFIMADGVVPSNKDRGYVLRMLIRRVIRSGKQLNIRNSFVPEIVDCFMHSYGEQYPHLKKHQEEIQNILTQELTKFDSTLDKGIKFLEKLYQNRSIVTGKDIFSLYETHGVPYEISVATFGFEGERLDTIKREFDESMKKHKDKSRASAETKFKGGWKNNGIQNDRLTE